CPLVVATHEPAAGTACRLYGCRSLIGLVSVPQPLGQREPVALVLAGGGARGAYEIGVLAALVPELTEHERPNIVIGTSVGAINAAYLAANADMSPEQPATGGLELGRGVRCGR